MNQSDLLHPRFQVPLHLMTGKGGVGRTTLTIDLGKAFARKGLKTLVIEPADADGGDSMLGRQLNRDLTSTALKVESNLYAAQLNCRMGHASFLKSIIPIQRLIDAALNSKPLAHFLNSAPSMYELGLFYHLWLIVESNQYDRIIVDLPATGHTLALTQLPKQLERMIRKGHLVDALKRGSAFIAHPDQCSLWITTLPERLPVSEALDLAKALAQDDFICAGFFLNRRPQLTYPAAQGELLHTYFKAFSQQQGRRIFEKIQNHPLWETELSQCAPFLCLSDQADREKRIQEILDTRPL